MRVKPQLVENKHGIIKLYGFIKNWWTLGRVLGFSPRVLLYGVPNHQYKCYGVVLNEFHVDY